MKKTLKIMIVAGEASGDAHAAKLVRALIEKEPETDFKFFGAAGPGMRDAGVEAVVHSDEFSVVGVAEIGHALPMFLRASRDLKNAAASKRPDAVILVDFPDFNLKLAKALKKRGFTIIYYISPQLWAWRKYRVETIRKYVDLLLTILPFENQWYERHGVHHVEYVGHPLANEVHAARSKPEFCDHHGLNAAKPIISLLPGSRHKEIVRILPVLVEAASKLTAENPEMQFVIPIVSGKDRMDVDRAIQEMVRNVNLTVVEGETYDALNASDAAAVTSGTATLETGIIGTPMVIVYKGTALNYALLKPLISVEHYGLINLIAGERIAKELIQHEFTAAAVSAELLRLLDPGENAEMREKLSHAREKLGHGGASKRAAAAVMRLINSDRA
jgi:lipid-A-disaccharide synthase